MSATQVAVLDKDLIQISEIRRAIEQISDVSQARDAGDQAEAIRVYAKAKKSQELVNRAVELRIMAERRAGQIIVQNGDDYRTLASEHGLKSSTVLRWVSWSLVNEDLLSDLFRDASDSDNELTIHGVHRRLLNTTGKKLERGIEQLIDGRYRITWRALGNTNRRIVSAKNIESARKALMRLKGQVPEDPPPLSTRDIRKAYADVRRALTLCDRVVTSVVPNARPHVDECMAHLHRAEDSLIAAMRAVDNG